MLDLMLELNAEGVTIIMIEHIMHAIMRFSERVSAWMPAASSARARRRRSCTTTRVQEAYLGA